MPITKHSFLVKKAEDIAPTIRRAFEIAASGRPGPVLIDITKDATANTAEYTKQIPKKIDNYKIQSEVEDFDKVIEMINAAERPFIYAGGGVIAAGASEQLIKFRELVDAPITTSLMGIGAFPESDPNFTGMIGMHGTKITSLAIKNCDLLIAIGARFSERVTCAPDSFAKNAKIIHIDADVAEIDKNIMTDAHLIGDAKAVLDELNKRLSKLEHKDWMEQIYKWKEEYPVCHPGSDEFNPQYVVERLNQIVGDDAIIVTDVGQHQMWTAQYFKINKPRHFISSGGLGTMGFGLGAAIGAKVANPDKTVINVTGDGCFHMNMQELATAAKEELQ